MPGPILAGCNVRTLFAVCLGSVAKSCSLVPSATGVHVRSSVSSQIEGCRQPQLVRAESSSRLSRCPFACAHREPLKSHISAALVSFLFFLFKALPKCHLCAILGGYVTMVKSGDLSVHPGGRVHCLSSLLRSYGGIPCLRRSATTISSGAQWLFHSMCG